jgi:hypothetical protein
MYPYQQSLLQKITSGGAKPGELLVLSAGRQTGKSQMQAYMRLWNDIHARPVEDLKLSEGTVYGSRYYCVEPIGGSWIDMEVWCLDTYDNCGSAWDKDKAPEPNARWYMNDRRFWFREQADQIMFVMRWR